MCGQELRRRLHAADPNLNIVPATGHKPNRTVPDDNWELATGVICTRCGKEVFRSRNGMCLPCWEAENEIEMRDCTGISSFMPMSIIKQITHQARKDKP